MKKIILSAAVAAMAFSTSAMAADKGIDINVGGQAAIYYQTEDSSKFGAKESFFSNDDSIANVGLQLNLGADLGNNFTFGSQLTYLGTAGLDRTVVSATRQGATQSANTTDNIALTKIFVAKKIANTTVKLGRQELPKSLSPLAFSEGWNVYKNTFDAILAVNTDIPNTTLVGAYVSSTTGSSDLSTISDMGVNFNNRYLSNALTSLTIANDGTKMDIDGNAYMITAQTTAIPMATVTASYYSIKDIGIYYDADLTSATNWTALQGGSNASADAWWLDVAIADKSLPMGLTIGLQVGNVDPKIENADTGTTLSDNDITLDDTTAYGIKIAAKPMPALTLTAAYTDVDGGKEDSINAEIRNVGGTKTPLFTQMVFNQGMIGVANDTLVLKAAYNMGDMGSVSVAYGMTDDNSFVAAGDKAEDYNEFDLVYKVKAGGVQYFAAYVNQEFDGQDAANANDDEKYDNDMLRFWARYNF